MDHMIGNLLFENLIETDCGSHSLPGLLAAMARGEIAGFPALRPHQRPAWHMFLVQLSVLALSEHPDERIPEEEDAWRAKLRSLTPSFTDDAPWHLVVEDGTSPAFLQPPDPGGLKWRPVATPDAIDMIITAKNHDLKSEIARQAEPQDWIFTLVSLQTMEGFGGAGNYGIARMNGAYSSRAMVGLAPTRAGTRLIDPAAWWRRDVARLLCGRSGLPMPALIWCLPWPEGRMLALHDLDPLFIETCRRIRLLDAAGGLMAVRANSKGPRINAKEAKGVTGDPWAPVHIVRNQSLTLGKRDWTYRLLNEILYSREWAVPDLSHFAPDEETADMILIAEAFARGKSRTDGFKSRLIAVPNAVKKTMLGPEAIDLANAQVELIGKVDSVLRNGLVLIAANGDRERRNRRRFENTRPARAALSSVADDLFFPALWDTLAAATAESRVAVHASFARTLAQAARTEFQCAASGIPCARILRPRAEARGRDAFERGIARIFREMGLKEDEHV